MRNFPEFGLKLREINRINQLKINRLIGLISRNFTEVLLTNN